MPELIDGVRSDIVIAFICLAVTVIQIFFSWKFSNVFVKLIPSAVNLALIIFAFVMFLNFGEAWVNLWVISLITLAADVVGWIIWFLWIWFRFREPKNPTGY